MLHLARIQRKAFLGKAELKLLARQKSECVWEIISDEETVVSADAGSLNEGTLILLELLEENQVIDIHDATDWVLAIIGQYLSLGVTPELLQQEMERAEQWRQSLTLQSQEVARRALETEARRDQIQELEENLKREKQQIQELEENLRKERQQLEELEARLKEKYKHCDLNGNTGED